MALRRVQSGKSPGPDGLESEVYKEEANISLVLKKGKDPENCGSYRVISLLNVDLKLLSKILAFRLEKILPSVIDEDQTGFIKDAEKAFDRVDQQFDLTLISPCGHNVT
ncbi:hypothetical protein M9458_058115 [Cirrhinus mrigala]|uniref:Reverse transcriptase domain-containing protein n=1 Tax=Cirrhinus mrigala TaxID=683832 RepID=A0ABD0MCJ1_CIRMR